MFFGSRSRFIRTKALQSSAFNEMLWSNAKIHDTKTQNTCGESVSNDLPVVRSPAEEEQQPQHIQKQKTTFSYEFGARIVESNGFVRLRNAIQLLLIAWHASYGNGHVEMAKNIGKTWSNLVGRWSWFFGICENRLLAIIFVLEVIWNKMNVCLSLIRICVDITVSNTVVHGMSAPS